MPGDLSKDTRQDLLSRRQSAICLGAFVTGNKRWHAQDDAQLVRSKRISEEVVIGSSMAKSPDYDEAKNHSLVQVIEHVFKEDEDPAAGYPVTRAKEFKVKANTNWPSSP